MRGASVGHAKQPSLFFLSTMPEGQRASEDFSAKQRPSVHHFTAAINACARRLRAKRSERRDRRDGRGAEEKASEWSAQSFFLQEKTIPVRWKWIMCSILSSFFCPFVGSFLSKKAVCFFPFCFSSRWRAALRLLEALDARADARAAGCCLAALARSARWQQALAVWLGKGDRYCEVM